MKDTTLDTLQQAFTSRSLMRFSNRFEAGHAQGYVVAVGSRLVLFAIVDEGARLNGFETHVIGNLRRVKPAPHAGFMEEALSRRGERLTIPAIDLSDFASVIRSAALIFSLVTVHQQRIAPEACWIGKVSEVGPNAVFILEIDPDAVWESEPTRYRLDTLTQVDFGGAYEAALALVAEAPAPPPMLH